MAKKAGIVFLVFVLGLACLATGCTRNTPVISSPVVQLIDSRPAIIVIHGFYGAALRKKNFGKRVFYSSMEAWFGNSPLSLFQTELGTPPGPELELEGLLGSVTVIPGIYEVDVYSSFIRKLRAANPGAQVLPLVYDWRDDLTHAVGKLDELVKNLQAKKSKSIAIVAHSMGGQIATYYLGYGNQPLETAKLDWAGAKNVQKIVFFGVPFRGSMIAMRSFEKGSGLPRSDRMLSADTMASFPSLYQLLPSPSSGILDTKGNSLDIDLFDPELWKKHHLGLLRRLDVPGDQWEAREKFVSKQLSRARRWNELLQLGNTTAWQPPAHLHVLNVVGSGRDTLDGAYLQPNTASMLFDSADLTKAALPPAALYKNGDETVTTTSSSVPLALEAITKVLITDFSHAKLFLDANVEKEYKSFLAVAPSSEEKQPNALLRLVDPH